MTRAELDAALAALFSDILDMPGHRFGRHTTPDNTLGWDSLAHVKLIAGCEERFDVLLSPEEQMDMLSFELVGDILAQRLNVVE